MSHKGVGARIAWSIESKRVLKELSDLLDSRDVQLKAYEEGERRRQAALASYALARNQGSLKAASFADVGSFSQAIQETFQRWDAAEWLTLFMQDSERKGVYEMTQAMLVGRALELLTYDGNFIYLTPAECSHGLLLDIERDDGVPMVFHLEAW